MLLSITKPKNLVSLAACILKSELLSSVAIASNRRTILTTNALIANNKMYDLKSFMELKLKENVKPANDPKDLGKIVSLDLDEVEVLQERVGRKKRKQNKVYEREESLKFIEEEANEFTEDLTEKDESEEEEIKGKNLAVENAIESSRLLRLTLPTLKSKKERMRKQEIILEGKRLVHKAISAGFIPKIIFFSRISDVETINVPSGVKLCKVKYRDLQLWSDVVTTQGVMGVFEMPDLSMPKLGCLPFTLICDNIREPGNMGAILRVAAAVGCEKLILTKGCVDIWDPKVLRSAAGAHFSLPMVKNFPWTDVENEVPEESKIILADNETAAVNNQPENTVQTSSFRSRIVENLPLYSYDAVDYVKQNIVLIIGGETLGLSTEAQEFTIKRQGIRVFIPMSNEIESLNNSVAFGILAYEIRRQIESSNKSQKKDPLHEEGLCTE